MGQRCVNNRSEDGIVGRKRIRDAQSEAVCFVYLIRCGPLSEGLAVSQS
ncbi:1709_t:CDS:2 [Paraglomus brasilianum]|uniref:1709_t:CDS:1 n=1 Tax=Paraglomus brasilianum TaxID=144538 RepID=A0A9N9A7J5_9GLOM|nr:1709_t:CDS:2 [Paraglomus brasilianum]